MPEKVPDNIIGFYKIRGEQNLAIAYTKKPWFIHRWLMKLLMGFKWEDR